MTPICRVFSANCSRFCPCVMASVMNVPNAAAIDAAIAAVAGWIVNFPLESVTWTLAFYYTTRNVSLAISSTPTVVTSCAPLGLVTACATRSGIFTGS